MIANLKGRIKAIGKDYLIVGVGERFDPLWLQQRGRAGPL
jgi:hypothetical protein